MGGYNNYVDIVESQLGREIAALQEHSTELFQASSFLEVRPSCIKLSIVTMLDSSPNS